MDISFARSSRSTLGIEWEVVVVDSTTFEQVPAADVVLERVADPVEGPIRAEYFNSMIEIVTGVHATVGEAVGELRKRRDYILEILEPRGLTLMGAGTHPFTDPSSHTVRDKEQYLRVIERNGWWGKRMAVNGLHVHTGVEDRDKALALVYGLARFAPYFIAMSAASPFWEGQDTDFASQRTMVFQQLPTNGLPYQMETWDKLEAFASQLEHVGMITNPSEIRWDVRPSQWGTVENRMMDSVPTLLEIGAIAAFNQCLVERMSRAVDADEPIDRLPFWFMRENKWRAARYGVDADIITPRQDLPSIGIKEGISHWIEELAPIADQLGCSEPLENFSKLAHEGPSYQRQRRVAAAHDQDLRAVASSLIEELRSGAPM